MTKIFHPNVSEKGEICVNTLKKDWNPANWSLVNILEVIKCLLIVPFPESALNEQAGKMFMDNYEEYFKYAKMLTGLYATPKELKVLESVYFMWVRILLRTKAKTQKKKNQRLLLCLPRRKTKTRKNGWSVFDSLQTLSYIFYPSIKFGSHLVIYFPIFPHSNRWHWKLLTTNHNYSCSPSLTFFRNSTMPCRPMRPS